MKTYFQLLPISPKFAQARQHWIEIVHESCIIQCEKAAQNVSITGRSSSKQNYSRCLSMSLRGNSSSTGFDVLPWALATSSAPA